MPDLKFESFPPLSVSKPQLLRNGSDDDFRQLVHNLLIFSETLQSIRAGFGALLGVSGIHYTLMMSIAHLNEGKGTGVKQLADHLNLSGAFVTNEINSLVEMLLVSKKPNLEDRRRVILTLTPNGKAGITRISPFFTQVNDALFSSLTQEDFTRLTQFALQLRKDSKKAFSMLNTIIEHSEV